MEDNIKDFLHNNGIYIYDAVEVIKEFYGEEFVDDSNIYKITTETIAEGATIIRNKCNHNYILIHFPNITVTNEYGKYTEIYDVYIKVIITFDGKLEKFLISKGTYTQNQAISKYIHSHTPRWDASDTFQGMCLGSGPFREFIEYLEETSYEESNWGLFCIYLKNYLEVESVEGTPYVKLETIGTDASSRSIDDIVKYDSRINSKLYAYKGSRMEHIEYDVFIKYLASKNVISYNYIIDKYDIAMSLSEFAITVSNVFIDFLNENDYTIKDSHSCFHKYLFGNGTVYEINEHSSIPRNFENKFLFKFKNKEVRIKIIDKNRNISFNPIYILMPMYIVLIYVYLIQFINKYYGTKDKRTGQEKFV